VTSQGKRQYFFVQDFEDCGSLYSRAHQPFRYEELVLSKDSCEGLAITTLQRIFSTAKPRILKNPGIVVAFQYQ